MNERNFRRRLRWTPQRPVSPRAGYVAALAVAVFGVVTAVGAESRPMTISGWLIVAVAGLAALRIHLLTRR